MWVESHALPRLMAVWGPTLSLDPIGVVGQAVRAGLRLLQLRDPDATDEQLLHLIFSLRRRFPELRLLVNRRAHLARETFAGLHLGERSLRPETWPAHAVWGRSVHSVLAARMAEEEGAHYVVLGTIFPTPSKPGHPGGGLELVWRVSQAVKIPVFAIGGIDASRVGSVLAAGAYGVAAQRAVLASRDPRAATEDLLAAIDRAAPLHAASPKGTSHLELS